MVRSIKVITGKVVRDPYGSWEDSSTGLYIASEMIEDVFSEYRGKNIKVTIEEIESEVDE